MRHILINLFFLLSICIFDACSSSSNNEEEARSMNALGRDIQEIKKEVYEGNTDSYHELRVIYFDEPPENFLYWALIMANKHDHSEAYLDVFYSVFTAYAGDENGFNKMDKKTRDFALEYLDIAAKKGSSNAKEYLKKLKAVRN